MISRILWISFLALSILGFFMHTSCAVEDFAISMEIELSEYEINAGDRFDVIINITNEEDDGIENADIEITISADGTVVHHDIERDVDIPENSSKIVTIESDDFKTEDDERIWQEALMAYKCGSTDIRVTVSGDVESDSDSETLDIEGEKLYVGMEPENPTSGSSIDVTVEDKDGDLLDNIYVRIVQLEDNKWDVGDVEREKKTNNGITTFDQLDEDLRFKEDPYGKYQLDAWEDDYCLYSKTFEISNKLRITEFPENPYTGEEIKVKILDKEDNRVEGARVAISGASGLVGTYNSDSSGYAEFSIKNTGTYTLLATKTGYEDSDPVSITVRDRKGMDVKIEPIKQAIGRDVLITVSSNENPIEGAEITIKKPDGSKDSLSASSAGKVIYKPGMAGVYDITVKKEGYETTTSSFTAMNFFNVSVPGELKLHEEITILLEDQNGKSVGGASVDVVGSTIGGTTDSMGRFTFMLEKAGEYVLSIKKVGFEDFSKKMMVYGSLRVDINPEVADLGDSIRITVSDEKGVSIEANMAIKKPDGKVEDIRGSSHTLVSILAGSYNVTASKDYYTSSTAGFVVNPYPLELNVWLSGSDLMVKATKNNDPIGNVSISVLTPDGKEVLLRTDDRGIARFDTKEVNQTGTFTISSVDLNYEKKTITKEMNGAGSGLLPLILLVVVIVFSALLIFFIFYVSHKKSKSSALPEKKTKKPRGKGLGNL